MPLGVRADQVADALARQPRATAVFTGDPSYVGTIGETAAVAEVAHRHGIPLVVDAAWGAHFGFHPRLPAHALGLGADALVTSVHKALPGQSQAALVLARTRRIDPGRLDAAVEATSTTSPAGSTLASIDASRALLARDGETLLDALLDRVARARATLIAIDGVRVLAGDDVDPAKLVVLLPGTGADGNRVERDLLAAGLPVEMADRDTLVPMLTLADGDATASRVPVSMVRTCHRLGAASGGFGTQPAGPRAYRRTQRSGP